MLCNLVGKMSLFPSRAKYCTNLQSRKLLTDFACQNTRFVLLTLTNVRTISRYFANALRPIQTPPHLYSPLFFSSGGSTAEVLHSMLKLASLHPKLELIAALVHV